MVLDQSKPSEKIIPISGISQREIQSVTLPLSVVLWSSGSQPVRYRSANIRDLLRRTNFCAGSKYTPQYLTPRKLFPPTLHTAVDCDIKTSRPGSPIVLYLISPNNRQPFLCCPFNRIQTALILRQATGRNHGCWKVSPACLLPTSQCARWVRTKREAVNFLKGRKQKTDDIFCASQEQAIE